MKNQKNADKSVRIAVLKEWTPLFLSALWVIVGPILSFALQRVIGAWAALVAIGAPVAFLVVMFIDYMQSEVKAAREHNSGNITLNDRQEAIEENGELKARVSELAARNKQLEDEISRLSPPPECTIEGSS